MLAGDGADLAAALATIRAIGDREALNEAIEHAFPGSRLQTDADDLGGFRLSQKGLLRPLSAAELSDGTLRYLLLVAALLSPRPPELMELNEPEGSLHPSLMPALARLVGQDSDHGQVVLVSHSEPLIRAIRNEGDATEIHLEKSFGETGASGVDVPRWQWPKR
ncbi:AAA family ATPase [Aurantimonas sp. 22II-16-19i]|uniref:AAA family ATPase n=1 Tax=Aurantimonas sp. 22II-16-19i TaxID=1317114 RepID=UPI001FD97C46|nr:AAA family ATPase [Aurantimonas sp. 22II-16-19i]